MVLFFSWLALALVGGAIAGNKGRSFLGFFALGIVLSPLIGIICALIARPNLRKMDDAAIVEGGMKKCPYCAETVRREAVKCKHCGSDISNVDMPFVSKKDPFAGA